MNPYNTTIPSTLSPSVDNEARLSIPWYIYSALIATCSIFLGLIWDVSWHMSIGRDTLFSAPHLVIYLGGVLGGIGGAYQLFYATFSKNPLHKAHTVWFWGFKAPLGALFAIWGALAMLTSAPFDDWWHNAYGLDVKILSPPHALLAAGMLTVQIGAMITLLSYQNRVEHAYGSDTLARGSLQRVRLMFPFTVGMILAILNILFWEYMSRNDMHSSTYYKIGAIIYPLILVATSMTSRLKWAATTAALFYLGIYLLMNWILPLFPAEPKLGPIHNPVSHYVTLEFPMLLFIPALAIDSLVRKPIATNSWISAIIIGGAFLLTFFITQWLMGSFLMTPYARNWIFFADGGMPYYANPDWEYRYKFYDADGSQLAFIKGMGLALFFAIVSTRIGISWGKWMQQVKR